MYFTSNQFVNNFAECHFNDDFTQHSEFCLNSMFLALVTDSIKNKGIAIPIVPNSETTKVFAAASSLESHSTERDAAEESQFD